MNMNTNMGTTVYWHNNQFITRLKVKGPYGRLTDEDLESLRANDPIKKLLPALSVYVDVQSIDVHQLPQPDSGGNTDFVFCHSINPKTQSQPDMELMPGNGEAAGMGNHDHTLAVINQINNSFDQAVKKGKMAELSKAVNTAFGEALDKAPNGAQREEHSFNLLDLNALPRWFNAGTPMTVGCPTSPPIPAEGSSSPGRWKLQFSQLPDALKNATGKNVTVLVLDTIPARDQISRAAEKAGSSNMLLQEMTNGMKWEPFDAVHYDKAVPPAINCRPRFVPDVLEGAPSERVATGKDIYGRHVGFPMEDHGLFIAGIIRDLAPEANIECIRVLNDFGVGDICTLYEVLIKIYDRMSEGGDLHGKPVVINLSLVVLPPEDDIPEGVTDDILELTRDALYILLQSLADQGAIFVAAAGNDSDPRMNASEKRFGPRYPAALASDDHAMKAMIPVGAVNRKGNAAMYSDHPGPNGIATYGGELPKPDPWLPSAMSHTVTSVDKTEPLDALRGVYSASMYPALSKNDHHSTLPASPSAYPMYHASNTWACWSGTSFATPIITALAARILQGRDPKSVDVQQAIIDTATDETMWTRVDNEDIPGSVIMAVQAWYPPVDPPNPNH